MIDRKELVEKMMFAFDTERMSLTGTFDSKQRQQCFSAALSVAIEELLSDFSHDECVNNSYGNSLAEALITNSLNSKRRAQIERIKTPEERVTIEGDTSWTVKVDGVIVVCFSRHNAYTRESAEIYRLGLIARLKEEQVNHNASPNR